MKKRWIFISAVLATLVIAITGGAIMAQDTGNTETSEERSFAGRVADILGLDEQTVSDAMEQVKEEMRDEAIQHKLDTLVEKGLMTQEEADEYGDWIRSMPDIGHNFGGFGHRSHKRGFGWGKSRGWGRGHGWGGFAPKDADATEYSSGA